MSRHAKRVLLSLTVSDQAGWCPFQGAGQCHWVLDFEHALADVPQAAGGFGVAGPELGLEVVQAVGAVGGGEGGGG